MTTTPAAPAAAAPATPVRPRRPLRGLLGGTALSVSANAMVAVLVPWLVLARTGSPAQAGLVTAVAAAAAVPALLAGSLLLDRLDRRRLAVGADLAGAATVWALPLLDLTVGLTVLAVCVLVAAGAAADGPGLAAREALRPSVARASGTPLERVNAQDEVVQQAGQVVGPALAGAGLALVGATGSLWLAGGLFVAAAAATATLPRSRPPGPRRGERSHPSPSGLALVWRDRVLRAVALVEVTVTAVVVPLPLVLTTHLQAEGRAGGLGLVLGAFAVGGVAGALGYGARPSALSRRAWLTAGLALAAAGLLAMAALPPVRALAALAVLVGLAAGPLPPVLSVLVQDRVPDPLLGRVLAARASLALLAAPAGALGVGRLLEAASPAAGLAVVAAGCATGALLVAALPALRRIERTDLQESP